MNRNRKCLKLGTMMLTAGLTLAPAVNVLAAAEPAAEGRERTCSITIHKYDITGAEAAGDYREGSYEATGQADSRVERALKDYAIEGVRFTYLRVGDVETHSVKEGTGHRVEMVYEIPEDLAEILKLSPEEAVDMDGEGEAFPCSRTDLLHYSGDRITEALTDLLKADDVEAKNALEDYLYDPGTADSTLDQKLKNGAVHMEKTDGSGYTCADGLDTGLYLIVETEVPEQVTDTVDPWFVQLPFTGSAGNEEDPDAVEWIYDMTCYPKDQTGNPTLDKSVRNADARLAQGIEEPGLAASGEKGFTYEDTATASEGDTLDYILVSKLPHITSGATFLSEYTFVDRLSEGLSYNEDVKIAFYRNREDADENRMMNAALIWDLSKEADRSFASAVKGEIPEGKGTELTVSLKEAGLDRINAELSDCYMVVSYTVTVHSDDTVVLGDTGNPNDVSLVWSRTSDGYFNVLEDRNYVYSYALDLTKRFSDEKGDLEKVSFRMFNREDGTYVTAKTEGDGIYHVTGAAAKEEEATLFIPDADTGEILINGLEADTYQLTEISTDAGYSLLKEPIVIDITATDREIIASVCGVTGMDEEAVEAMVRNYRGGIFNENGDPVNEAADALTESAVSGPAGAGANGRTIGKTDLYEGEILPARAAVDGVETDLKERDGSAHAEVTLTVTNSRNFELPKTGGNGLYAMTILGVLTVAGGCFLLTRKHPM